MGSSIAGAQLYTNCGASLHLTIWRASRRVSDEQQHTAKTFPLSRSDVRTIEEALVGDSAGDGLLPTADIRKEFGRAERNIDTRRHWEKRTAFQVYVYILVEALVRDSCY